jgi:hypothetical protein
MRTRFWTALAVALLALPAAAKADSLQEKAGEAEQLATEAMAKLLRALDLMVDSVPQYAAPEVLPNGDIIIRRLNPQDEQPDDPTAPVETGGEGVET